MKTQDHWEQRTTISKQRTTKNFLHKNKNKLIGMSTQKMDDIFF